MDPEQNPPMTLNEAIKAGGKPAPPKTMQDALAQGGKPVSDPVSASAVQTPSMAPAPADMEPWYSGGNPNKPLDWLGTSPTGAAIPAEQLLRRALPSREIPGSVPVPIGGGGISVPAETLAGAGLGAGRAIEGLTKPGNLAMGLAASPLLEAGMTGMILKTLFSGQMLKSAYDQFMEAGKAQGPPREQTAGRVSAGIDALMSMMPWAKYMKGSDSGRPANVEQPPSAVIPPEAPPSAPLPTSMATPAPAMPPEAPVMPPLDIPAAPELPTMAQPPADFVFEPPEWLKRRNAETDAQIARIQHKFVGAKEKPEGGWDLTPESLKAESEAKAAAPVGALALVGQTQPMGQLPELPYDYIPENLPPMTRAQMKAERENGLMGRLMKSGGMRVDPLPDQMLISPKGKSGRFAPQKGFTTDLDDPVALRDAFPSWSDRQKLFNTSGKFGRAGGIGMDELPAWARENGYEGFKDAEDILEHLKDPARRHITPEQMNNPAGPAADREGWEAFLSEPELAYEDLPGVEHDLSFDPGRLGGEEGFARLRDQSKLGRSVEPEDFTYGFIGPDGKLYQTNDIHRAAMAKAMGMKTYGPDAFSRDMKDSELVRARNAPRDLQLETFAPLTDPQRRSVAGLAQTHAPSNFNWEVPPGSTAGKPYGYGLGDFLRAIEGEGGMSRIKDEKSGLFDFGNLAGVASLPKRGDNPLVNMAEKEPAKVDPIKEFHDQLVGIQNQTRQQAMDDLVKRVMSAPDSRISKRELLGLKKSKVQVPPEPSLLFKR